MITDDGGRLMAIALTLGVAILTLSLLLWRVGARPRPARAWAPIRLRRDEHANATIEFALVLPVLLFLCLVLTQTTLLMGAPPFVHYASFVGARAAIVQIPRDTPGAPGNYYVHAVGDTKHDAIHRAAAMSLLPICPDAAPRDGSVDDTDFPLAEAMAAMYERYGRSPPPWLDQLYGRAQYALANTEITVGREIPIDSASVEYEIIDGDRFDAKDAIAVRVDHRYSLTVPWANRVYADGTGGLIGGGGRGGGGGVSYWRLLSSQTRLTGAGVLETLPPAPGLPRLP
jgi:hypothetical protein